MEKHFICQTNLKTVSTKGKKKLQKVYNTDKHKKLNEVPVPVIYDSDSDNEIEQTAPGFLKRTRLQSDFYEAKVLNHGATAKKSREERLRLKKEKEEKRRQREEKKRRKEEVRMKRRLERRKRKHEKDSNRMLNDGVRTKSRYPKEHLHPKKIVEDFSNIKFY